MQSEPPEADEDRDLPDPALEAIAAAILDGAPIDWQHTSQDADRGILDQLRVLAELWRPWRGCGAPQAPPRG